MRKLPLLIAFAAGAVLAASLLAFARGGPRAAEAATPANAAEVTRAALAAGLPGPAPGYRLSLFRVVIPPHASLAPHHHPGMQAAYIVSGQIRYTVFRGRVAIHRGAADEPGTIVRRITAGQTGTISAGEWIVETRGLWHRAANPGDRRTVILLATLLRKDKPPAIPVTP